jgi:hypothetical protein
MDILQFLKKCIKVNTLNPDYSSVTISWQFSGFNVTADCLHRQFKISRSFLDCIPFTCCHKNILTLTSSVSNL